MNVSKITFHYITLLLIAFLGLEFSLSAQAKELDLSEKSTKEIKNTAKSALRIGDTYTALFYYEEWANRSENDIKLMNKTADLYRITRNYKKAEQWYKKSLELNSEDYIMNYFWIAEVQLSQAKYKLAKENFEKFKSESRDLKDPKYRKLSKSKIASCDYALSVKDKSNSVVKNLDQSINMPHIEFSPIPVSENEIIYGSLKEKSVNFYSPESFDSLKVPLRKLYTARNDGDNWTDKGELSGPFNNQNKNVGNAVLSEDGKRIYFTLCEKNWQNRVICELYYSEKNGANWEEATKMNAEINIANYTTTQPAIGRESKKNREIIYFVSDRPGGKGGLDIWYTEYRPKKDYFKTPRNAGSKINSVGTECTPYYDISTHKLYFSTDGLVGLGGLDVYSSDGEKSKWEEPQHLQKEINSSADDLDFTLAKDKEGGFLVSNRVGGNSLLSPTCCDDIYEFKYTEYVKIKTIGKVTHKQKCLTGYTVKVYIENKTDNSKYLSHTQRIDDCEFDLKLESGLDYSVEVEKPSFFKKVTKLNTQNITDSKTFNLDLDVEKIPTKPIELKEILYEFNSPELTAKAKAGIDSSLLIILTDNPKLKVRIGAHTDSKGTEAYNKNLSQKRANSVVKYLIAKGISKNRLEAKGYGESRPIAKNENADGSDNPEGRKLNRRTELEIIGEVELEEVEEED